MRTSDFAIITPSVTANECYFMKLPFIAIQIADNQKQMSDFLQKQSFPVLNKFKKSKLEKLVLDKIKKKAILKMMWQPVRDAEKLIGKVDYSLTEKKKKSRQFARSLYVSQDIKKGESFTEENIRSVRPGYGMHPKYLRDILRKKAKRDYEFGERFLW